MLQDIFTIYFCDINLRYFFKSSKKCVGIIRVIVIGGKCIGGMLRQNDSDFRSNIEIGGTGKQISLNKEQIAICFLHYPKSLP